MMGWYLAKCQSRREAWLAASLAERGVEIYFPRVVVHRRGSRVVEPLFPTYLFCRFSEGPPDWASVRWAPGLTCFLGQDGVPKAVPDGLVDQITRLVEGWEDAADETTLGTMFRPDLPARKRCKLLLSLVGPVSPVELDDRRPVATGSLR